MNSATAPFLQQDTSRAGSQIRALLVERTRGRLALFAGLIAGIALFALILINFLPDAAFGEQAKHVGNGQSFLVIQFGSSVLIALLAARNLIPARALLWVGAAYGVWVCWNSSVGGTGQQLLATGMVPFVTFTEVLIVFFPLIVPTRPGFAVATATLSASTRLVAALFVSSQLGVELQTGWWLSVTIGPFIAVCMALVGARVIYGLGVAIAEAKQVGSYQLQERLGKGGMGEVWRARHKLLARPAAVKLIRPNLAHSSDVLTTRVLDRFEREAQATAMLQSPHTVKLFDFGRAHDGTFYYVMELLEGVNLHELVERFGPISPERATYFILGVCHSLAEAHAANLAHRDIKPANIVACKYGLDHDVIKVLDFGLVTGTQARREQLQLTAAGDTVGSPAFMSPEAVKAEAVDHRADIYSIGCLFHWLLAGRLVFQAKTAMAMGIAHVSETPQPLSQVCEQPLPDGLETLVSDCLQKDPTNRPPSAQALAETLRALPTTKPWTEARAHQWWDRHRPLEAHPRPTET